jgi:hypothetical protein
LEVSWREIAISLKAQKNEQTAKHSWLPKLRCTLRKRGEHSVECGLVDIPSQCDCDIAYGRFGREIMFRAQLPNFFCHDGAVLERAPGFLDIPVRGEKRPRAYGQYTHEANSFLDFESAPKNLENPFHHRVSLIGRCQAS